ncbi:MAG: YbaK/EbsC family protein [Candidatus Diapherotrites archaeon]
MLEDFIEVNSVNAEIVPGRFSENSARCVLLLSKETGGSPVLAIVPGGKRLSLEKAARAAGSGELREASEKEDFEVTGYKHGFLPPISIYGVKVLVEKALLKKPVLNFLVKEECTLRIAPQTIMEFNEDVLECSLLED